MNRPNVQYRLAWPPFTKSIIGLAIAFFALWIGPILIEPLASFIDNYLTLSKAAVVDRYQVWTLFTYAFFHNDFFGVFFTAFALWIFGAELQKRWSTTKWWIVQLIAVVLGGAVTFAGLWIFDSALPVKSYHAGVMALVTGYCWLHWRAPLHFFFFEMTGRTMLLFFLGLGIAMGLLGGYWPIIPLDLAGVAVGFLGSTRTMHPRDLRVKFRNWRLRRNLKVVRSPEDKPNGKSNGKSNGTYIN